MTSEGIATAEAAPARGDRRASRRERRRARLRRFFVVAHLVTGLVHVVPVLGLAWVVSPGVALSAGLAVYVLTAVRLGRVASASRMNRLVTVLLDQPVLAHWSAAILATLLFPLSGLAVAGVSLLFPISRPMLLAAALSYCVAAAVAAWAVWVRRRLIATPVVEVPIEGLPAELDGYRIVHATDLHIGAFDTKERGLGWAARASALEPDLVAVTGDLVTAGTVYYRDVAEVLGAFRARDGVVVSLGNHDQWDPDALTRLIEERGPRVLRNSAQEIARGESTLVVAGIDDWSTGRDDLPRALSGRKPGAPTVLLSHYPEFFAEASRRGVDLVLSGHTHGGQIGVPFLARRFSLSALARQAEAGLHVHGKSRLYLNAGLGTTGPPVRLGVPPELAVLVLRAA